MPTNVELIKNFELFRTNPNSIQRYVIEILEQISEEKYTILDPSNPFVFLLEASAMMASATMNESQSRARELYPVLAVKPEDIYRHMSDRDYLNQFSAPGKIVMSLVLNVNEIKSLAVKMPDQNYKKLTIPKDTIFSISDYDFGLYYPIDIKVTIQDGLQIDYNTEKKSPLKILKDNKIDFNYFYFNKENYINIDLPMEQFTLTSHKRPLNVSVGFNQYFDFEDYYFYCRVYTLKSNTWIELETTHSKEVFNVDKITAQLTLLDKQLLVNIPLLYFSNQLLGGEIRVDIYTTKGDININLGNFSQDSSSYQLRDLDSNNKNIYSSALGKLKYFMMYSASVITGGSNGESFEQIRQRVIDSRSRKEVPVRYDELRVYLADRGYVLVKSIDNVTDRVFIASKKLPNYGSDNLSICGSIESIKISQKQMINSKIIPHDKSYTFLPKGLYLLENGIIKKLSDLEEKNLYSLDVNELLNALNSGNYFYNPLHYLLDKTDDYTTFTPYLLNCPKILSRYKISENTLSGYQLKSHKINIKYTDQGYILKISTICNEKTKLLSDNRVYAQLSFLPEDETLRVFTNATVIGTSDSQRVFEFKIESDFEINRKNYIGVKNFTKTIDDTYIYKAALSGEYNLTFIIDTDDSSSTVAIDDAKIGEHLLPDTFEVLTVEELKIFLGEPLDILLSDSRLSVESKVYDRYESNVPKVYTQNVYKRDPNGIIILETDPDTNKKVPVILHKKGDSILDENGEIIYEYKIGDIKLKDGKPIVLEDRTNLYFLDIFLLNAIYLFATNIEQKAITENIPKTVSDFLNNDLGDIKDILLERTELYYTPKKTISMIKIQTDKNTFMQIKSTQEINIVFYVDKITNKDDKLKLALEISAKENVLNWINDEVLSISVLISTIMFNSAGNIDGVNVYWSGPLKDIDTFTIVDSTDGISVKQELIQNYDLTLEVVESIKIQFIEQGI